MVDEIIIGSGIGDFCAKNEPWRMIASTAELPSSHETPAPFRPFERTYRCQRAGNEVVSVTFVDFPLALFRKPADDVIVCYTDH